MDTYRVGSNIDAWCTKCKLMLAHTIEALADRAVKRVQCNTCKGKHQYKAAPPGTKKPASPKKSSQQARKNKSKASDYERLVTNKHSSKASFYNASHQFSKGDLIDHKTFGLGIVVDERDVTKIEVLFEAGPKILIHARNS